MVGSSRWWGWVSGSLAQSFLVENRPVVRAPADAPPGDYDERGNFNFTRDTVPVAGVMITFHVMDLPQERQDEPESPDDSDLARKVDEIATAVEALVAKVTALEADCEEQRRLEAAIAADEPVLPRVMN
jgi:hypothetical protein